jgi:hypothetical protein
MTLPPEPGIARWNTLREAVITSEDKAVTAVNRARDALLRQGDLFGWLPEDSPLIDQLAREAGIGVDVALHRRRVAQLVPPGGRLRSLLVTSTDIGISWRGLEEIMLAPQPEVFLTRAIKRARSSAETRLASDDVRRVGTEEPYDWDAAVVGAISR